jgi:hypothetical protein
MTASRTAIAMLTRSAAKNRVGPNPQNPCPVQVEPEGGGLHFVYAKIAELR